MGGGVGISVHGSHRIVTETSKVGMPETGIGLFPDVGGTYALARIPHPGVGQHLALTGQPIGPGDAIRYGLADTFVPRDSIDDLATALAAGGDVDEIIARFAAQPPDSQLEADEDWIAAWATPPPRSWPPCVPTRTRRPGPRATSSRRSRRCPSPSPSR
jgi:enoyl-CoA hydratase